MQGGEIRPNCELNEKMQDITQIFIGNLIYDGTKFPFESSNLRQVTILGRNVQTGSIITAWYNSGEQGFMVASGTITAGQWIDCSFVI